MSAIYNQALTFATKYHAGQMRRGDAEPYINHPIRVAERLGHLPEHVRAAALLHDVLEKTDCTLDVLSDNFDKHVVYLVKALTHDEGVMSKREYLSNIINSNDVELMSIKWADCIDNALMIGGTLEGKPFPVDYIRYAETAALILSHISMIDK